MVELKKRIIYCREENQENIPSALKPVSDH